MKVQEIVLKNLHNSLFLHAAVPKLNEKELGPSRRVGGHFSFVQVSDLLHCISEYITEKM